MFEKARGQFAVSLWDRNTRTLILGRDRVGICPLYYTEVDGWLLWASEIKALLASGMVAARPDPRGVDHLFSFFCAARRGPSSRGSRRCRRATSSGSATVAWPGTATGTSTSPTPGEERRTGRPDADDRGARGPDDAGGRAPAAERRAGRELHQRRPGFDGRAGLLQPAAGRADPGVHDRVRPGGSRRALARHRGRGGARLAADHRDDGSRGTRRRLSRADPRGRGAGARHLCARPCCGWRSRCTSRVTRSR